MNRIILRPLGMVLLFAAIAQGQGRSAGLHGAYATLALGAEAPWYNPANLAFTEGRQVSLALMGVSGWCDDNAFGLEHYRRYNGAFLDAAAKAELLDAVSGGRMIARAGAAARPFAIAAGPAAFSLQSRVLGRFSVAEELFDLALNGNTVGRDYDFIPADGKALWLSDFCLSYGYSPPFTLIGVHSLSFGVNAHFFLGSWYAEIEQMRASALTRFTTAQAEGAASVRTARGGRGWGIDLGMTAVVTPRLRLAVVAENIATTMRWDRDSERLEAGFTLHATNVDRILAEDLELEDVVLHSDSTRAIPAFQTRLPQRWHAAASWMQRRYLLSAQWRGGGREAAQLGGAELALGGEYAAWPFLRLRGGVGHSGDSGWSCALGLGLQKGRGRWDIAWQGVGSLNPGAVRGGLVAMSFYVTL